MLLYRFVFDVVRVREDKVRSGLLVWLLCVATLALASCDRTQEQLQRKEEASYSGRHVNATTSPQSVLKQCLGNYQSLKSYQDTARCELSYQLDGSSHREQTPMQVAWDGSSKLGFRIHELQAGPTQSNRWHAKFMSGHPELAGQILSRPLPHRVDLDWLMSDSQVAEYLSRGPFGFPPQLNLLLSSNALENCLKGDFKLQPALSVQRHSSGDSCWVIQAESNNGTYRFWIERATYLLRRLELPAEFLPDSLRQNPQVSELMAAIEFGEIQTDQTIDWSDCQLTSEPNELRVGHFVPEPPAMDLRGLGKSIPAFQLRDAQGKIGFQSTTSMLRKASVLVWLADHPACWIAAQQLSSAAELIRGQKGEPEEVEFVAVWAEPEPPSGMSFEELRRKLNIPGPLVIDRAAAGRDLFQIEEAPTIIVLDAKGRLQLRDIRTNPVMDVALAPLIQRIAQGHDLAKELLNGQQQSQLRHTIELALAGAADRLPNHPYVPDEYSTDKVRLTELGQIKLHGQASCLFQDKNHTAWLLLADGSLQQVDANLKMSQVQRTDWRMSHGLPSAVVASSDSRYFACVSDASPGQIDLFDAKLSHSTSFPTLDRSEIIDFQWLTQIGTKMPRLAVVTSSKQLLLLDPENRQQLSGSCPADPLAIVWRPMPSEGILGLVALEDRTMQPIHVEHRSATSSNQAQAKTVSREQALVSKLSFSPNDGPWYCLAANERQFVLASGWIEEQQPGLFLLDDQLHTQWHYRLPLTTGSQHSKHQMVAARSPQTGAWLLAVLDDGGTIHLLSADGQWTDHCRISPTTRGLALIASGDHLVLLSVDDSHLTAHRLD